MRWDDSDLDPQHQHHLFESSLARPIHLDGDLSALDITIKKEVLIPEMAFSQKLLTKNLRTTLESWLELVLSLKV
jgi:hypothetical protein